jgi:hypothetical protein
MQSIKSAGCMYGFIRGKLSCVLYKWINSLTILGIFLFFKRNFDLPVKKMPQTAIRLEVTNKADCKYGLDLN